MHFEHKNGKRVTTALFNGYPVGDGILEDVLFECEIVDDKVVVKADKVYMSLLVFSSKHRIACFEFSKLAKEGISDVIA